MTLPAHIESTKLGQVFTAKAPQLIALLLEIRQASETISAHVARLLPIFTDHSARHMDALWHVSEHVLTTTEMNLLTRAELFLLCSSFYVHDLGMAIASTQAGLDGIRASPNYEAAKKSARLKGELVEERLDQIAIEAATRELHADIALKLTTEVLPGLGRYLIESSEARSLWADALGSISASHNWDLARLNDRLDKRHLSTPFGLADCAYVACLLRVVDYAHMNRDRAPTLERLLRGKIGSTSVMHWNAQSNILGPHRDRDLLCYASSSAISRVDDWWLFYDMAVGLDQEIRKVRDYLAARTASKDRFSLFGVGAVESAATFCKAVQLPEGIQPIDIRVHPDSMERLVELLGGPSLYGSDALAPIRELLQNARDAIELQKFAGSKSNTSSASSLEILIYRENIDGSVWLTIEDNGIGMNRVVLVNYLVGVASQFWTSVDFARDFGSATERGFQPVGRFGIGFLSVFMMADDIEVVTARAGSPELCLKLRGVGHRGEITQRESSGWRGTRVRLRLKERYVEATEFLFDVVKSRAPMLSVPMRIKTDKDPDWRLVDPLWWKQCDYVEIEKLVSEWGGVSHRGRVTERARMRPGWNSRAVYFNEYQGEKSLWPDQRPETVSESARLRSSGVGKGSVLVCGQGFAIAKYALADAVGIVDIGRVDLSPSRDRLRNDPQLSSSVEGDAGQSAVAKLDSDVKSMLAPAVIRGLNAVGQLGKVPLRWDLLIKLADVYGSSILTQSEMPWIPVLDYPGNIIHRSSQEFGSIVASRQKVAIAIDLGWVAIYDIADKLSVNLERVPVCLLPRIMFQLGHSTAELLQKESGDTLSGSLADVLERCEMEFTNPAFREVLKVVAAGFGCEVVALERQMWHVDLDKKGLWCMLTKPADQLLPDSA